jgi:hypothetical protein
MQWSLFHCDSFYSFYVNMKPNSVQFFGGTHGSYFILSSHVWRAGFPWQVYLLVCTVDKFFLTSFSWQILLLVYRECCSTFISRQGRLILFAKTTEVRSISCTQTNCPCPKTGMTSFGTRLLVKEKLSTFCRKSIIKLVKEKLPVCMGLNSQMYTIDIRILIDNF